MKQIAKLLFLNKFASKYPAAEISLNDLNSTETEIYRQIKSGSVFLKFSKKLENIYQSEDLPERLNRYFITGIISTIIYNLLMITDYITFPSLYQKIFLVRLVFLIPVMTAILLIPFAKSLHKYFDIIAGVIAGILVLQAILILNMSYFSYTSFYNIAWLSLIPVILNVVIRINFSYGLVYSIIVFTVYLMLSYYKFSTIDILFNFVLYYFIITVISVVANFSVTRKKRDQFLYKLLFQIKSVSLEKANKELTRLSNTDDLSGLKNRRCFDNNIEHEWKNAIREKKPISLIFIDIDYFKKYNDHYGHQAGDSCIRLIADVIRQYSRRPLDLCARYGGEEFVILLPNLKTDDALKHAERIRESVAGLKIRHEYSEASHYVTISLGVAGLVPVKHSSPDLLIAAADKGLYKAKANGRNRVEIQNI
ncbi:MAG: diguanylate cyclase [Spirochaetes bacterium]|nr:diguanylate cyclase [Spirochaetota bacterium]